MQFKLHRQIFLVVMLKKLKEKKGYFLVDQLCAFTAEGMSSSPGQGTKIP